MKVGLFALGLIATLGLAACGDDGDDDDDVTPIDASQIPDAAPADAEPADAGNAAVIPEDLPDPLPTGPVNVKVVTFNTGLIQAVKGAQLRLPLIVERLETVDADVVCLQEVYNEYESPAGLAETLSDVFPYSYWNQAGVTLYSNGMLLLSKYPLYRGRVLLYEANNEPPFPDRALISAHVVAEDWAVPVMCTHLQAGLSDVDSTNTRHAELDEIDAFAQEQGYLDGPVFLLGDFNLGPDPDTTDNECDDPSTTDVTEECAPADMVGYNTVLDDGWTDPFPLDAPCSSCRWQYLALELLPGLWSDEPDQRIDHCFYRGLGTSGYLEGSRIFDEEQTIMWNDEVLKTLSDHYGVRCVFGPDTSGGGM